MTVRSAIRLLLMFVLGLPLVQAIFLWVAALLRAMGDDAAAAVLGYINTATGIAWLVALVGLVIALAVNAIEPSQRDN